MILRVAALVSVLFLSIPLGAWAQTAPSSQDECNYERCALWRVGSSILAGERGETIASFGAFASPNIRLWIESSDSAAAYLSVVEETFTRGRVMSLLGTVTFYGGLALMNHQSEGAGQWIGAGVSVAGISAMLVGNRRVGRADRAMASSMWWYNRTLAVGTPSRNALVIDPELLREPQERAGALLGTVVGLAVGLVVSSHHSSVDEVGKGISEAMAFASLGSLVGWQIGLNVRR